VASIRAETSGLSAQDCYSARGPGGGAKKRRGNGEEYLILVAFITGNSSLEPLIEGLYAQIHVNLR